jgi:hypothetical protein
MQRIFRRAVAFVVVGVVFAAAAGASEAATPVPRLRDVSAGHARRVAQLVSD